MMVPTDGKFFFTNDVLKSARRRTATDVNVPAQTACAEFADRETNREPMQSGEEVARAADIPNRFAADDGGDTGDG